MDPQANSPINPNKANIIEKSQNTISPNFFLNSEVKKCILSPIENRFDVLLKERGIKWADAYHEIGIMKSYASKVRRGIIIPPIWMRIKIAQFFKVDTSVIWREPELISVYKEQNKEGGKND